MYIFILPSFFNYYYYYYYYYYIFFFLFLFFFALFRVQIFREYNELGIKENKDVSCADGCTYPICSNWSHANNNNNDNTLLLHSNYIHPLQTSFYEQKFKPNLQSKKEYLDNCTSTAPNLSFITSTYVSQISTLLPPYSSKYNTSYLALLWFSTLAAPSLRSGFWSIPRHVRHTSRTASTISHSNLS